MPSISGKNASGFLRAANSAQTAVENYNDSVADAKWRNSAKTDADWREYSTYLQDRDKN